MFTVIIVLTTLFVIFAGIAAFLSLELHKKFDFMSDFVRSCPQQIIALDYEGGLNLMKQVRLIWDRPFTVLVGFENNSAGFKGYDYFGYVESQGVAGAHTIVIETYFGHGAAQFQFLLNQPYADGNRPTVVVYPVGTYPPTAVYPPHWWQKYLPI